MNYSTEDRELFIEKMTSTNPTEALSLEAVVSNMLGREISSMEATPHVPTMLRSPRLKQIVEK